MYRFFISVQIIDLENRLEELPCQFLICDYTLRCHVADGSAGTSVDAAAGTNGGTWGVRRTAITKGTCHY